MIHGGDNLPERAKAKSVVTPPRKIDPLADRQWAEFVEKHPRASVFHTRGWLDALRRTYGYEPVVYTTTPPGIQLTNGVVLCRVYSRITGRRMVSLPFSDHCEPLVNHSEDLENLLCFLETDCRREGCNYVEMRPRTAYALPPAGMEPTQYFYFHTVDLNLELEAIFHRLHKDSTQRKIRRAEREGLIYEEGRSDALLEKFYRLLVRTRQRHRWPPQPRDWFCNLVDCLGEKVKIRVASKDGHPIASILTLSFRDVLFFKYGCSDERFHNLGGVHLLLWNTIEEGKSNGARVFELGRSDSDNLGLVIFKEHWGAARSHLTYWRYQTRSASTAIPRWGIKLARNLAAHIPDTLLIAAGKLIYRHIG